MLPIAHHGLLAGEGRIDRQTPAENILERFFFACPIFSPFP